MFFIVDICISLCLRAPRKIDSSIGLPSLNKVVTYLLTMVSNYKICYQNMTSGASGSDITPSIKLEWFTDFGNIMY